MSKFPEYDHTESKKGFDRALKVVPSGIHGHLGPDEGFYEPLSKGPLFSERAKGAYIGDVDGNKYIDYMCAYGPNVLGYCDEDVDNAVKEQIPIENCTTIVSHKMVECAELLQDTVDCADGSYFMKNGGDTTTFSVICARAFTNKKKIIFFDGYYHGSLPGTQNTDYPGVIEEDVSNNILLPGFDIDALDKAYAESDGDIAAIIAQPYDHGCFHDNVCATKEQGAKVRQWCDKHEVLLIIDDVRCGFRLDLAGSDHYYGFKADLLCLCKALANGYTIACVCGREFLRDTASAMKFTGSYWLSAVPFAASIACINKMKKLELPKLLKETGTMLTEGLVEAGKKHNFNLIASGEPSLFYLRIANDDTFELHKEGIAECVSRGVFLTSHHNHFMNAAMTKEDINHSIEVAEDAFSVVAKNHPELDLIP